MTDAKVPMEAVTETTPGLFTSRLASKEVKIQETTFHLKALPSLLATHLLAKATDGDGNVQQGIIIADYLKYGITKIDKLRNEEGKLEGVSRYESVILGSQYWAIENRILDGLPIEVLTKLFGEIQDLTHLSEAERRKLDFTTPSGNEGSTTKTGEGKQ